MVEDEVIVPIAQPQRPFGWDSGVQQKFGGLAEPVFGATKVQQICDEVARIEKAAVVDFTNLLA